MASHEDVLEAIQALRKEIASVREAQNRTMKAVSGLRHEVGHRIATSREELGALVKASHAELAERLEEIGTLFDEQHQRVDELERDFDALIDGHGG